MLRTCSTLLLHNPICFIYPYRIDPYYDSHFLSTASISSPASLPASIARSTVLPSPMTGYILSLSDHWHYTLSHGPRSAVRHSYSIVRIVI